MAVTIRGSGQVPVQIQTTTLTSPFSTSSTSFTAVTGLTVSITPTNASNKVLVTGSIALSPPSGASTTIQIQRNGTPIYLGNLQNSQPRGFAAAEGSIYSSISESLNFVDSPATTSAVTYQIYMLVSGNTGWINQTTANRASTAYDATTASTITAMEIAYA